MTQEEYQSIDWNRGNVVRLTNGKEYSVRGTNKKYIILYSEEYQKHFAADYRIIDCRTSDNIEPFVKRVHPTEKHLKKQAAQNAAQNPNAAPGPKHVLKIKAAPKPEPKAEETAQAPEAEQPAPEKRKRKRITISRSERVQY